MLVALELDDWSVFVNTGDWVGMNVTSGASGVKVDLTTDSVGIVLSVGVAIVRSDWEQLPRNNKRIRRINTRTWVINQSILS